MPTIYKEVEVDVELDDFDDVDLLDEVERRNLGGSVTAEDVTELVDTIYHLRRQGRDYEQELERLIYAFTGRAV